MRPRTARAARRLALEPLEARLALATLFVATDGSDANDGTSAAPWRTLQHAANLVNPGDTIILCERATTLVSIWIATARQRTELPFKPKVA
jgi:hypothetical protein